MSHKRFDDFIKQQSVVPELDATEEKRQFLVYLDRFYEQVESFLKPYVESKRVQIQYRSKKIFEELIGEYDVKAAVVVVGNSSIKLDPIGTIVIGAKGRVDMTGPCGSTKFVLVDSRASTPRSFVNVGIKGEKSEATEQTATPELVQWEWKRVTAAPRIKFLPTTATPQESFLDAVVDVTNASAR
jgi:hypothetical protein